LLRILLAFRDDVSPPRLVGLGEPADAVLLIGDTALHALHGAWPHPQCYDLGEEWTRWTGLPAIARTRRYLGLPDDVVVDYLRGFTYRLGPDEEKAMAEFRRLLALLPA